MSRCRAPAEVEILLDDVVDMDLEAGVYVRLDELGPTPVNPQVVAELRARVSQRRKPNVGRTSRYGRRGGVA